MEIVDCAGNLLTRDSSPVKVRLVRTFKKPDQGMLDINNEVKSLSEADLDWYRQAFIAQGYPTT